MTVLSPASLARIRAAGVSADVVSLGYIQDVASTYLTVTVGGGDVRVPMMAGTYTVGQFALIVKYPTGWWALGPATVSGIPVEEADPVTEIAPPAVVNPPRPAPTKPKPAPVLSKYRWVTLAPTTTGTYRGGWRSDTNDLFQGDWTGRGANTGFAGFGSKIKALRADTTRTRTVRVKCKRLSGGSYSGQTPTFWTTSQGSRPGGNVTRLDSTSGPSLTIGETDTFDLPADMRDDLLTGTAKGLAIYSGSSPYIKIDSGLRVSVYYAPR